MPRTWILIRFGLLLFGMLGWPLSGAVAGPIISASRGSSRHGRDVRGGDPRDGLTSHLLAAVGQEMTGAPLSVRAWLGAASGGLTRDLTDRSPGTGTVGALPTAGAPVSGLGAAISAPIDPSPTAPNPAVNRANSLDRAREKPDVPGEARGAALPGMAMAPTGDRGNESHATEPVPVHDRSTSSPDIRSLQTAGQGRIPPSAGGTFNPSNGSSPPSSTPSAAIAGSALPQGSAGTTAPTNANAAPAVPPQSGTTSTPPSTQGAASPGTGSSPPASTGSSNSASAPASPSPSASVSPVPVPAPGTAAPMTGAGTSIPQAANASTTLPTPTPAIPMAAGPIAGPTGTGTGPVLPATGTVNPPPSAGNASGVPLSVGATNPGSTTSTTVNLIAAPGGADGSSSPIAPASPSQPGATNLVPIVASPQATLATPSALGPSGSTTSLLNAALGGSNGLSSATAATVPLVAPAPPGESATLPPVQVGPTVLLTGASATSGGSLNSLVLPQNTPEPGAFALFAMVSVAVVIKGVASRRRSRD